MDVLDHEMQWSVRKADKQLHSQMGPSIGDTVQRGWKSGSESIAELGGMYFKITGAPGMHCDSWHQA